MECESLATESACGCVRYYMPRLRNDTKICTRQSANCYENIRMDIEKTAVALSCTCLPACFEINYS